MSASPAAPSGDTEPGTRQRRRLWMVLGAVALFLVLIWVLVAVLAGSAQSGADSGPELDHTPAQTLKQSPQNEKLGSNTSGE
jgi:hypothetical protein